MGIQSLQGLSFSHPLLRGNNCADKPGTRYEQLCQPSESITKERSSPSDPRRWAKIQLLPPTPEPLKPCSIGKRIKRSRMLSRPLSDRGSQSECGPTVLLREWIRLSR